MDGSGSGALKSGSGSGFFKSGSGFGSAKKPGYILIRIRNSEKKPYKVLVLFSTVPYLLPSRYYLPMIPFITNFKPVPDPDFNFGYDNSTKQIVVRYGTSS